MVARTCAAATACSEPGHCSEHVTAAQLTGLAVTICAPILLSVVLPRLTRATAGPSPHRKRALVAWPCCAVPHACASGGLLVVIWLLTACVVPPFFMLLAAPLPCTTALGGCGTISCSAANYYFEGYVFMFVVLSVGATVLAREISSFPDHTPWQRNLRALLILGGLLALLTGIFPERFGTNADREAGGYVFFVGSFSFHLLGLLAAMGLFNATPLCLLLRASRAVRIDWTRILAIRGVHALAALAYFGFFAAFRTLPDASEFCAPFAADPAGCAAWPNLTDADCKRLGQLASGPDWLATPDGHRLPTTYRCVFVRGTLSEAEGLLLPPAVAAAQTASCYKGECRLYENARSIALEFGLLYLVAAYMATYALPDMRWVLELEAPATAAAPPPAASRDDRDDLLTKPIILDRSTWTAAGSSSC